MHESWRALSQVDHGSAVLTPMECRRVPHGQGPLFPLDWSTMSLPSCPPSMSMFSSFGSRLTRAGGPFVVNAHLQYPEKRRAQTSTGLRPRSPQGLPPVRSTFSLSSVLDSPTSRLLSGSGTAHAPYPLKWNDFWGNSGSTVEPVWQRSPLTPGSCGYPFQGETSTNRGSASLMLNAQHRVEPRCSPCQKRRTDLDIISPGPCDPPYVALLSTSAQCCR